MKKIILVILTILSWEISHGQDNRTPKQKIKNIGCFMEKDCRDTIYEGVLKNDSIIDIECIYIRIRNKMYVSFINDSVFEIGQFRRFNAVSFFKSRFVRMEKKRYWKRYNTKRRSIDIVDNYSQFAYIYIRIFPCFRLIIRKNE